MILIKSGTVVNASGSKRADILIENDKIVQIGANISKAGAQVVNAEGRYLLPGGIDPHTHFDLPMFNTVSSDDHYSGHKAAAFGGTTTVIDFVPQEPNLGLKDSVTLWHRKADPKAAVDFSFHMNISSFNSQVEQEIPHLIDMGITTLKVFTAYNHRLRLHDGEIYRLLKLAKQNQMLTLVHAENGDVIEEMITETLAAKHTQAVWHARSRPAWLAAEAVLRVAAIAAEAKAPIYVVHMNTAGGLDMLNYARGKGVAIMGETCPQYLFFNESHLLREDGSKWICSPPVRYEEDNKALWEGLIEGQFQVVATDHCPFFYDGTQAIFYEGEAIAIPGKELGKDDFTKIPNGLPGVQDRMPILWSTAVASGAMNPEQFVALTSTNAAKIFGLYPRKGVLAEGSDADIVIWDPTKKLKYGVAHSHQRTDYNLYEGWDITGYPEKVYLRGQLIVDGSNWLGRAGLGQFLKRSNGGSVL